MLPEVSSDASGILPALGRRFQLWDYAPSGSVALFRSQPDDNHEDNVDLRFDGVEELNTTADFILQDLQIEPVSTYPVPLSRFNIKSGPPPGATDASRGTQFILAEKLSVDSNDRSLFDGLPDANSATFEGRARFELAARLVLESIAPAADITSGPNDTDLVLQLNGHRVGVELKWSTERPIDRQLRQFVITAATRWHEAGFTTGRPLAIFVAGTNSAQFATSLPVHLRTAFPERAIRVFDWESPRERSLGGQFVLNSLAQ